MPKRVGFLYEQMEDYDFIKSTILQAADGKKKRGSVVTVLNNIDECVLKIQQMLVDNSYKPAKPYKKNLYDPNSKKTRELRIVPFFPDAIMQWLLIRVMKDTLMRGMYEWSCASIPGRGPRKAKKKHEWILQKDKENSKYCAQLDIKKFFYSIDINVMMKLLRQKFKDEKLLNMVEKILVTSLDNSKIKIGVPIGFYLSQWLSNFYLESLDHFITSLPGINYYLRYMDNLILYSDNKNTLQQARRKIQEFLAIKLHLTLKEDYAIFEVDKRMASALGYRFSHTTTILQSLLYLRVVRRYSKIMKKLKNRRKVPIRMVLGFISNFGMTKVCYFNKRLNQNLVPYLLRIISNYAKKRNRLNKKVLIWQ